jgi:hypothetical protein
MKIITRQFEENQIEFDIEGEGFVNATEMAKATGKQISDFFRLSSSEEYIKELESAMGIPRAQLYYVSMGNYSDGRPQGTWVHRKLAIRIAQWCSPKFAVWVDSIIESLFLGKQQFTKQDELSNIIEDRLKIGRLFGLSGNQLLLSTNRVIKEDYNFDIINKYQIELKSDRKEKTFTPSEIGKELNKSARDINKILESKGYQTKVGNQWVPTQDGTAHCEVLDVGKKHSNGTPVKQIKWYMSALG